MCGQDLWRALSQPAIWRPLTVVYVPPGPLGGARHIECLTCAIDCRRCAIDCLLYIRHVQLTVLHMYAGPMAGVEPAGDLAVGVIVLYVWATDCLICVYRSFGGLTVLWVQLTVLLWPLTVLMCVQDLWRALSQPAIWRPCIFIFMLQASPPYPEPHRGTSRVRKRPPH